VPTTSQRKLQIPACAYSPSTAPGDKQPEERGVAATPKENIIARVSSVKFNRCKHRKLLKIDAEWSDAKNKRAHHKTNATPSGSTAFNSNNWY
jgi:hypothetical protein